MSGHSKWSQIKRQKGVADAKRGQIFTKLGNAITIAVREGGGPDPESNFKLRLMIEKARENNMPKENVQRAIERALGKGGEGNLSEVVFEGFAPGGAAVIIEAVTDNHLRTQAAIKNVFNRMGGNIGGQGSVAYLFNKCGVINIFKDGKSQEEIFLLACDCGAIDVEESDDLFEIFTHPQNLHEIKKILEEKGLTVNSAELVMRPLTTLQMSMNGETQKIIDFLNMLEDLDDVLKVYSNLEILGYEKN
jgi:YebC/PmpR family DNA-binding regulatory protein